MQAFNLIWFKRDLRWQDHDALDSAFKSQKPLLALFCFEPLLEHHDDGSARHRKMQEQALIGMLRELGPLQKHLIILEANADEVLTFIAREFPLAGLFSHQEHGVQASYQRDKKVKQLSIKHQINWQEFAHNGVVRGLSNRNAWDESWRSYMQKPLTNIELQDWPQWKDKDLLTLRNKLQLHFKFWQAKEDSNPNRSLNRYNSIKGLEAFLQKEAHGYQKHIGAPFYSKQHCSRLSVALAWGSLSLREVYQSSMYALQMAERKSDLKAFISRLHWHSHFIQKFEMEMRMEFENLNRGYNSLRTKSNPHYLEAWTKGETGIPLVDACMRAVRATGYLNFRMRAMVVSFWSHLLWQPWQDAVHYLAQCFSDYIPGIHYPQFQMQSSVTGINAIRVYSPIKQSLEKDAEGKFLQKWLPELSHLPLAFQHEPWKLSAMEQQFYNFQLGRDYPAPLIDVNSAAHFAREELWKMKQDPLVLVENKRILKKHTVANRKVHHRSQIIMKPKASK